jgi:hypothetical protein
MPDVRFLGSVPFGSDEDLYPLPDLDHLRMNFSVDRSAAERSCYK